jgi:hypothetical protein
VDERYKNTIDYVIVPHTGMEGVMVKKYRHIVNDLWLVSVCVCAQKYLPYTSNPILDLGGGLENKQVCRHGVLLHPHFHN